MCGAVIAIRTVNIGGMNLACCLLSSFGCLCEIRLQPRCFDVSEVERSCYSELVCRFHGFVTSIFHVIVASPGSTAMSNSWRMRSRNLCVLLHYNLLKDSVRGFKPSLSAYQNRQWVARLITAIQLCMRTRVVCGIFG